MQDEQAPDGARGAEALPVAGIAAPARRRTLALAVAGLLLALIASLAGFLLADGPAAGWAAATRLTARVSALFFLPAFAASALAQFWRSEATAWLLRERRGLGLGFCASHTVHLLAVIGRSITGDAPSPVAIVGGGLAYLCVFAMALTSDDRAVRRIGPKRWRQLHLFGMHYLWAIFTLSYLGRVVRQDVPMEHALLFTLMVYAMLLRLYQWLHRPR
jgi:DMSO/TMAO reductase YedYZ heme-binding membrane subunit